MKLVYTATNKPVLIGDIANDFRGEPLKVLQIIAPTHEGSTGRVVVQRIINGKPEKGDGMAFYPGVINAGWVPCNQVQP